MLSYVAYYKKYLLKNKDKTFNHIGIVKFTSKLNEKICCPG